mmetsp:Transcript_38442/g.118826  ORF Transcript_38442/g.118826 Transcript_38442/m.118826 type:complete len:267 (+) Transcript_38442:975-1775(+)
MPFCTVADIFDWSLALVDERVAESSRLMSDADESMRYALSRICTTMRDTENSLLISGKYAGVFSCTSLSIAKLRCWAFTAVTDTAMAPLSSVDWATGNDPCVPAVKVMTADRGAWPTNTKSVNVATPPTTRASAPLSVPCGVVAVMMRPVLLASRAMSLVYRLITMTGIGVPSTAVFPWFSRWMNDASSSNSMNLFRCDDVTSCSTPVLTVAVKAPLLSDTWNDRLGLLPVFVTSRPSIASVEYDVGDGVRSVPDTVTVGCATDSG